MLKITTALFAACLMTMPALAQDTETPAEETPQADPTLIGPTTEWQICNETSYVARTATAFLRGGRMVAKGWDEILPGDCLTQITPVDSPRFFFAESSSVHQGGVREWRGATPLCASDEDFESDATEDCRLARLQDRDYASVRPGEPVTTLVEPNGYSPEEARIAVLQRLLRDNDYGITRIDGLAGRGTSQAIRRFRQDRGLERTVDGEPLIRALMEAARERATTVGLEVCNESSAPVWAAIATRNDGTWRSRGWWRTPPDECSKPITAPLPGTDAHVYAVQEVDEGPDRLLRTVSTTPAQFCISDARFDALGNELCIENGYAIANFRPVPMDADGARMRLSDSDFVENAPDGLRR